MKHRYFFTYGTSESMPFKGGWTVVMAESMKQAIEVFNIVHPPQNGLVNCSSIYSEEAFKATDMYINGENFGYGRREIIALQIVLTKN